MSEGLLEISAVSVSCSSARVLSVYPALPDGINESGDYYLPFSLNTFIQSNLQ